MKKRFLFLAGFVLSSALVIAQTSKTNYPVPEYSNEIYLVKRDSAITLMRLEKGNAKQLTKVKMMGMGGMDQGYELEGEKSTIHLPGGSSLVFLLFNGSSTGSGSSPESDSIMKANGMDPNAMSSAMEMFTDPTKTTSLYSTISDKGKRKILTQSMGLMGKSKKTATKYTLSIRKIKEGYYELVVDKTLPKGEYSFVLMGMGSMDQSYPTFSFAVE